MTNEEKAEIVRESKQLQRLLMKDYPNIFPSKGQDRRPFSHDIAHEIHREYDFDLTTIRYFLRYFQGHPYCNWEEGTPIIDLKGRVISLLTANAAEFWKRVQAGSRIATRGGYPGKRNEGKLKNA